MINASVIIQSILGMIALVTLFYSVGRAFNFVLNKKKVFWGWLPTYFYLLCGMLLSVSLCAVFFTKGITILAIIPLLLILFVKEFNKKFAFEELQSLKKKVQPFIFLSFSIAVAYLYYLQSFRVDGDDIYYIWGDQEFYSRVAENIACLGIENLRVEYLYPSRFTVEPYHYGDIWTVALAFTIGHVKPIYAGVLIAFPVLLATTSLGAASIVQYFFLKGRQKVYILYLLLFLGLVGGFAFLFPNFLFPTSVDVYARSMSNYTKLIWWAASLPLIFSAILNKKDDLIIYLVFIIGLGYINVLPSIALGSFLWLLFISTKRKTLLPTFIKMVLLSVISVLFIYLLYAIYPSLSGIKKPLTGKAVFSITEVIDQLRTSINIFIGGFLQLLVYLPPLILLGIYLFVEKVKILTLPIANLIVYAVVVMISALLVWALLFTTTTEAIQFFYNVFVVIAGLLSALIYLYVATHSSHQVLRLTSILLLILATLSNFRYDINVKSVNRSERDRLFQFLSSSKNKTFAFYRNSKDYTSDIFASNTVVPIPYSLIEYEIDHYENFSLNVPFTEIDTSNRTSVFHQNNIAWSPMYHFKQLPENRYLNEVDVITKFMNEHKITFLCMPIDEVIPKYLSVFTVDSLYTPQIGWKMYKCAYPEL
jgi:hypothetical protein